MKKLLLLLALAASLHSCSPTIYAHVGMSLEEFNAKNNIHNFQLEEQTTNRLVLKYCTGYYYQNYDCTFYYFNSYGFIYQIDKGEYVPDLIIQTTH